MHVRVTVRKRKVEHRVSEGECFNISKIHKKFKQHSTNMKNYTTNPYDMVHVNAKFEKIQQCVFELVRKLNVTDGRTDGGVSISPVPGLRRGWR